MRKIGADHHRSAVVKLANLDLLSAAGCLQKDKLRSTTRSVPTSFFEAQDILVKGNGFFQVMYAIASVQESFDHGLPYRAGISIQTASLDKVIKTASLRVRGSPPTETGVPEIHRSLSTRSEHQAFSQLRSSR